MPKWLTYWDETFRLNEPHEWLSLNRCGPSFGHDAFCH